MAISKKQTILSWMTEALSESVDGKPCNCFVLVHQNGGTQDEVDNVKFSNVPDVDKLAQRFQHKAEGRVQDAEGSQQFWVLAFYGDSQPAAKFPFRINVMTPAEEHPGTTEPPSKEGLIMQAMRHVEVILQTHTRQENSTFGHMERLLNRTAEMLETSQSENRELVGVFRQVMLDELERKQKDRMETLAFERATNERAMLMRFAPGVINKVLGTELIPQNVVDTLNIEALAESLTPDQTQKLMAILSPEQFGPLAQRLADIMERKRLAEHNSEKDPIQ